MAAPAEEAEDAGLRPRTLAEFVGQAPADRAPADRHRGRPASGTSRSTTSCSPARPGWARPRWPASWPPRWGSGLRITAGPVLVRAGDLAALLTDLQEGDVLFIDEIHRLHRSVEEILYPAMEDFKLDILIGKGPTARSIRLDLPRFTLVGATTRTGLVAGPAARPVRVRRPARPLRRRRAAGHRASGRPASSACPSTPRAPGGSPSGPGARRASPTGCCAGCGTSSRCGPRARITSEAAVAGLEVFGVDELGLDKVDRAILDVLCRRFAGRPVGLTTLAQCIGEEPDTIEDAYEPYLLQQGLLQRTTRGRVAAPRAWAHLGLTPVESTLL